MSRIFCESAVGSRWELKNPQLRLTLRSFQLGWNMLLRFSARTRRIATRSLIS
jgi:hypothetical protein